MAPQTQVKLGLMSGILKYVAVLGRVTFGFNL